MANQHNGNIVDFILSHSPDSDFSDGGDSMDLDHVSLRIEALDRAITVLTHRSWINVSTADMMHEIVAIAEEFYNFIIDKTEQE